MVVWSSFSRSIANFRQKNGFLLQRLSNLPAVANLPKSAIQLRQMGGHGPQTFVVTPSRFQWHKFKDMLHFYVMLGLIPITAIVLYCNIFIGPATLTEIPEGYEPKHWEYHRHPISRFLARYVYPSPQQEYEKMCHSLYEENERIQLRRLERQIREKMSERNDYQAYYYRPALAKYYRVSKEAADYLESIRGD